MSGHNITIAVTLHTERDKDIIRRYRLDDASDGKRSHRVREAMRDAMKPGRADARLDEILHLLKSGKIVQFGDREEPLVAESSEIAKALDCLGL